MSVYLCVVQTQQSYQNLQTSSRTLIRHFFVEGTWEEAKSIWKKRWGGEQPRAGCICWWASIWSCKADFGGDQQYGGSDKTKWQEQGCKGWAQRQDRRIKVFKAKEQVCWGLTRGEKDKDSFSCVQTMTFSFENQIILDSRCAQCNGPLTYQLASLKAGYQPSRNCTNPHLSYKQDNHK